MNLRERAMYTWDQINTKIFRSSRDCKAYVFLAFLAGAFAVLSSPPSRF